MEPGLFRLHTGRRGRRPDRSTQGTAPLTCRNAASSTRHSPGAAITGSWCHGNGRSSTRPMSAASRMLNPAVPEHLRGTFAGLGSKSVLDYIKSLGVTSVELLPIHTFINDSNLLEKGLTNYWGYNSIGFFAPDPTLCLQPRLRILRIQADGGPHPRRRTRGDPGRRLQPHRRGQRAGGHPVLQGHRQRQLLPAAAGQEALLYQRHRHRETRSTCRTRACCRWSRTACATGWKRCMSTGSGSISAPSWRGRTTASTRVAGSSTRAGRTRCSPASS